MSAAFADLRLLHVVVPLRSLASGKARLGGSIDAEERETLLRGMLRRTLAVLDAWPASRAIHLVSTDPGLLVETVVDLSTPVRPLLQRHGGLNEALRMGRDDAVAAGATAVLMLPADLPYLSIDALDGLLEAADAALAAGSGGPVLVIAPSDARQGTNALLLSPPDLIEPCFGLDSFEAHLRASARVGAALQVVDDPALGFDVDTPEDLERLESGVMRELSDLGASPVGAGVE
ncbi:MAG: 2-phospho-L-lactate guanylyltransferase [Chloroflexota bacterium]|nr:2-phospho-L-lactate guanylyltransferase [Chloroflexota bacterium]